MFKKLCIKEGKGEEEDDLRNYILGLGLAEELNDEEIFIPSLVPDNNMVGISLYKKIKNLYSKVPAILDSDVDLWVKFTRNKFPVGGFEKILCLLAKMCQDFSIHSTSFQKIGSNLLFI